jgi:hypothetical protein
LVNNHHTCRHKVCYPVVLHAGWKIRIHSVKHLQSLISVVLLILFINLIQPAGAQNAAAGDTTRFPKHSPRKATFYSMALPGLGQAYNHKYWKIPVIYAGFGTLAYFIHVNNKKYVDFKEAYKYKAGDTTSIKPIGNPYVDKYDASQLLEGQNYYRRNLEVSIMFTAVLYLLNVVDAAVDAHFFDYNISDDLTMRLDPFLNPPSLTSRQGGGFKITLSF